MSRLQSIRGQHFDVAIIGGGVIGAGIARDAALRGFTVALFEKRDYASGTTSGSSRLIHGGLRYLEMFDFGLVRMDLRERETLLRIAKHLVKPLEFLVPFYDSSLFYRTKMRAGMLLYDLLSYDKSLPRHRILSAAQTLEAEPGLRAQGLQGAAAYWDAQVESAERLAVENIVDARDHGAQAFNYAWVLGGLRDNGRITGIAVKDVLDGAEAEVSARIVVNASGPWFDRVAGEVEGVESSRIRTTKGVHLACPPATKRAVVMFSPVDRRLFFVIPFCGLAWISTTDTDFTDDPAKARATREDVDYLQRSAGEYLPSLRDSEVYWTNTGVRALVRDKGSESSVSRVHKITRSPGLISVLGGKITGFRAIAQEVTDRIVQELGQRKSCTTAHQPLPGSRSPAEEQCVHLSDYMLRRGTLGFAPDRGRSMASAIATSLAPQLGWDAGRTAIEVAAYLDETLESMRI